MRHWIELDSTPQSCSPYFSIQTTKSTNHRTHGTWEIYKLFLPLPYKDKLYSDCQNTSPLPSRACAYSMLELFWKSAQDMVEGIYPFLKVSLVLHVVKCNHFVGCLFCREMPWKMKKVSLITLFKFPGWELWHQQLMQQLPARKFQGLVKQLKQTQLKQR